MARRKPGRRSSTPRFPEAPSPRRIDELETPSVIVDLDRLATNLEAMATYTALHGLTLRPHVKTHKSPRIAADQIRLGAIGLTCATPRELEVMGDVSHDLLLAYPLVGATALARTPFFRSSCDTACINASTPAFAAAYALFSATGPPGRTAAAPK